MTKSTDYFIRKGSQQLGPFSLDQLRRLERRGQVLHTDQYSTDRRSWRPLSELNSLFPDRPETAREEVSPVAPPSSLPPPQRVTGGPPASLPPPQRVTGGPPAHPGLPTAPAPPPILPGHSLGTPDRSNSFSGGQLITVFCGVAASVVVVVGLVVMSLSTREVVQPVPDEATPVGSAAPRGDVPATVTTAASPTDRGPDAGPAGAGRVLTTLQGKSAQKLAARAVGNVIMGWRYENEADERAEFPFYLPDFVSAQRAAQLAETGADITFYTDDSGDKVHYEMVLGGGGSCFLVTPDGYALTNNHVVEEFDKVSADRSKIESIRRFFKFKRLEPTLWVVLDGVPYRAKLLHRSDTLDYAILKVPVENAPHFRLSTDDEPARLTRVMALGFPAAAQVPLSAAGSRDTDRRQRQSITIASSPVVEHEYVLTEGKVTSIAARSDARWIQHDAAISSGNSGGPLVDRNCVVLGINTLEARDAQGTFFALQLNQIRDRIKRFVPTANWR